MEKVPLPIKTKIAVWWMIVVGIMIVGFIIKLLDIINNFSTELRKPGYKIISAFFILALMMFICSWYVLQRKKWAYEDLKIISEVMTIGLAIGFSANIFYGIINDYPTQRILSALLFQSIILCLPLIPFILLLLDRKNFWKIAT